ncbi:MAG: hypothetical protein HYW10_02575, partial [Candidatus Omnitrophica bacterium]|nr:hypothetical protein [Candidatus Omnitrophota bacterium]
MLNGGTIEVQGNFVVGPGTAGGSTLIKLTGTGTQTYTQGPPSGVYSNQVRLPNLEINKASGNVLAAAGTTSLPVSNFTLTAGSF